MSKKDVPNEKRRQFLKGATIAGAAALATPHDAAAQVQAPARNAVPLSRHPPGWVVEVCVSYGGDCERPRFIPTAIG